MKDIQSSENSSNQPERIPQGRQICGHRPVMIPTGTIKNY